MAEPKNGKTGKPEMTKEIHDALGEVLTTEEHFVIHSAKSVEEARKWLDGFRAERVAVNEIIRRLRAMAGPEHEALRELLVEAANMIQNKEEHIAMLRGQVAGLEHRAEAAEHQIGLRP